MATRPTLLLLGGLQMRPRSGSATSSSAISEQLRRRSVVAVESTIPPEMTIQQWRRRRSGPA